MERHLHHAPSCLPQGEDADEARERPAWMLAAEGEGSLTSPSASAGGPSAGGPAGSLSIGGSAPATARAGAGGAADLLDLLGE